MRVRRLSLLVTGVLAAGTTVLARMAAELHTLGATRAETGASVERGLRRALSDDQVAVGWYEPALAGAVAWAAVARTQAPLLLVLDDSRQDDRIHLLRLSLAYWGGAVPVAWAVWEQHVPLPAGDSWTQVERLLATAARVLPAGLAVVVLADRAFDVPAFVDRVTAVGWHWLVRAKARSALRYRPQVGAEQGVRAVIARQVQRPGQRWKGRGGVFKKAGWRPASVVAYWAPGEREPVVVLSDLPPRWEVLAHYQRRFWIEASFRADKTAGWQWEASGVVGVGHHTRLVLAMAWATLLTIGIGVTEALLRLARLAARPVVAVAGADRWWGRVLQPVRHAVFTLGRRRLGSWRMGGRDDPFPLALHHPTAQSWADQWRAAQIARNLAPHFVRP